MDGLRDDGGPAFPRFQREHIYRDAHDRSGELQYIPKDGMSLRDHFAAKALEGYLASFAGEGDFPTDHDAVAAIAYAIADAMVKAREP